MTITIEQIRAMRDDAENDYGSDDPRVMADLCKHGNDRDEDHCPHCEASELAAAGYALAVTVREHDATIATLRADLARVTADLDADRARYRAASAHGTETIERLTGELARVTGDRDRYAMVARAANEVCESWKNGCEKAETERDEARAKVAGLVMTDEAIEAILAVLTDATCSDADDPAASVAHATFLRYAEALGGGR